MLSLLVGRHLVVQYPLLFLWLFEWYHPLKIFVSTSIVGTDIRLSNLDIHMSKLILEFEKIKNAKNSRLNVAFKMFFWNFYEPNG